jgi:hypothetical protein
MVVCRCPRLGMNVWQGVQGHVGMWMVGQESPQNIKEETQHA